MQTRHNHAGNGDGSPNTAKVRFEDLSLDDFNAHVATVLLDIAETLERKRMSYGPGNLTRFGEAGIVIRMGDKMQRLENYVQKRVAGEQPSDVHADGESIADAFRDIIGYAVLALIYRDLEADGAA